MFKQTFLLTEKEKRQVSEMCGKIIYHILEGNHMGRIVDDLNLPPWKIEHNIDEMLYILKKQVGWKRYLKILFMK